MEKKEMSISPTILGIYLTEEKAVEVAQGHSAGGKETYVYWHKTKKKFFIYNGKKTKHNRIFICYCQNGEMKRTGSMGFFNS